MVVYIVSVETLKEVTSIHDNIDPKLIKSWIKVAQDLDIKPLLGTALYNKIVSDIQSSSLSGAYKTLVDDYLTDTLCWYTMKRLPMQISYQFWNKGVLRSSSQSTEIPPLEDLITMGNDYSNIAESYADMTRRYLKQNAADSFPEYLNPGDGCDTVHPEDTPFTSPFFLDYEQECE